MRAMVGGAVDDMRAMRAMMVVRVVLLMTMRSMRRCTLRVGMVARGARDDGVGGEGSATKTRSLQSGRVAVIGGRHGDAESPAGRLERLGGV